MKKVLYIPILLLLLIVLGCQEEATRSDDGSQVLVRIGSETITTESLETELERIPPFQRREMETPEGKQKFLERLVEMRLLYQAALDEGLDKDEAMASEFAYAKEQILMRHYYKNNIEALAVADQKTISDYYDEHQADYEVKARVKARLILSESKKASRKLLDRVAAGEEFPQLAREESKDGATAAEGGDLGWFTKDGYIRSLGVNEELTTQVFELDAGQISQPISLEGKGWALIMVEEKEVARTKSLQEVEEEINRRLAPKIKEEFFHKRIEELKIKFNVEFINESFSAAKSAEELFDLAQKTKEPLKRIGYYKEVVERFPDSGQADRAQFMVGFVFAEELKDQEQAKLAFGQFMKLFPESDLAKDAQYMLASLAGEEPEFESE
jgi:peptidyl-prolyl cis-trans isomerase C